MNNVLNYKGFIGSVQFSSSDNLFFGKVEGINDLITFEGESVKELTDAFHFAVDEHIRDCEAENIEAEKSYKGTFNVRISPELHRRVAIAAKTRGISINKIVNEALLRTINH